MILNWCEEITELDPSIDFRRCGGWLKTVEGLDKSVMNGYSITGDFVKAGDYKEEMKNGLYLDCNKEGRKSKPKQDIRLIRLHDGKLTLVDQVYDGKKNWAVDLWDSIGEELNANYKQDEAEKLTSLILDKTGKDKKLINDIINNLSLKVEDF
ncbi:MAG: hypothetical protein PHC65_06375 [Methanobacteriaceae archaeon]|jgi:hypothetical protein|uniref:hypothetical protein n=1 Tax=Methanobrevibacter TaxID=2172 RepID=UPI002A1261DC|nr:hypothetical protein [Methanobacteriaceae archaeon]MDD3409050.1 hypothetical protein [Methanobacteriaceae archaeon]MDD4594556.1 hypothetical protein [Methanobacteriaceae archaeon]